MTCSKQDDTKTKKSFQKYCLIALGTVALASPCAATQMAVDSAVGMDLTIGAAGQTAIIVGGGNAVAAGAVDFLSNIGVGVQVPAAAIDVGGLIQISGTASATPPTGLSYGLFPQAALGLGLFSAAYGEDQGIAFWTKYGASGTPAQSMTITNAGFVGIGTTKPDAALDVVSQVSKVGVRSTSLGALSTKSGGAFLAYVPQLPTYQGQRLGVFTFGSLLPSTGGIMDGAAIAGYSDAGWGPGSMGASLAFETSTVGVPYRNERMRITGAGNVGIGTTTPGSVLDVYSEAGKLGIRTTSQSDLGNASGGGFLAYTSHIPTAYGQRLGVLTFGGHTTPEAVVNGVGISGWSEAAWGPGSMGGYLSFETSPAGSPSRYERMHISGNGNIGVGTNVPSYLLTVNGTIYAAGGAGALSDARHKDQVETLSLSGLDVVGKLRPVSFVWKNAMDDGMKGKQLGFIAQEVEKILPEVVLTEANDEKTKGLKYNEMIPVLTKAIQELKEINDKQAERIRVLEEKVEAKK